MRYRERKEEIERHAERDKQRMTLRWRETDIDIRRELERWIEKEIQVERENQKYGTKRQSEMQR